MSKVSAGGGKQGKSGKSRSKGSGADIVATRTESLATSRNNGVVTLLRKALRNDDGTERDDPSTVDDNDDDCSAKCDDDCYGYDDYGNDYDC